MTESAPVGHGLQTTTAERVPTARTTAARILLGAQLRRLREAAGVTRAQASDAIRGSQAKISRIEAGRVGFKRRDLVDLLALYGVDSADEHRHWLEMAEQANSPGWWRAYGDALPAWFETYLRLEQAASVINAYEVQFVPGLLQSEGYARAVIAQGRTDPAEIEHGVRLRMQRRSLLTSPNPPRFQTVIDEAALRRRYGTPEVHRDQIALLTELAELPSITIRVLPFERGGHARVAGAFSLLLFDEPELPDLVYLEQLTGSIYLDKRAEVLAYTRAMNDIEAHAADPQESVDLLRDMLRTL